MLQRNAWKKGRIFFSVSDQPKTIVQWCNLRQQQREKELRRFKACDLKGLGLLFSFQGQKDKKDVEKSFSDMYQTIERIQTVTAQVKLIVKKHNNFAAVLNSKKSDGFCTNIGSPPIQLFLKFIQQHNISHIFQFFGRRFKIAAKFS